MSKLHMKISLRDLFWLVLLSATVMGWWVNRSQLKSAMDEANRRQAIAIDKLKTEIEEVKIDAAIKYTRENLRMD